MKKRNVLNNILQETHAGRKRLGKTRCRLFKYLKAYLRDKPGHIVELIPEEDELYNWLTETGFYPSSVTIMDKHGFAASSTATSVRLTSGSRIVIQTDEAGKIEDAEEYLPNDDLFALCLTIGEYESLLRKYKKTC